MVPFNIFCERQGVLLIRFCAKKITESKILIRMDSFEVNILPFCQLKKKLSVLFAANSEKNLMVTELVALSLTKFRCRFNDPPASKRVGR